LRHISATITLARSNFSWKLIGFYGHPNSVYREASWQLMSCLSQFNPHEWLWLGDFNEIVANSEKYGGALRNELLLDVTWET